MPAASKRDQDIGDATGRGDGRGCSKKSGDQQDGHGGTLAFELRLARPTRGSKEGSASRLQAGASNSDRNTQKRSAIVTDGAPA